MENLLKGLFILLFIATGAIAQERTIKGIIAAREAPNPLSKQVLKLKKAAYRTTAAAVSRFSTETID